MSVLANKSSTFPFWLVLSALFHSLIFLIPLSSSWEKGEGALTVGEIGLVDIGEVGAGGEVTEGAGSGPSDGVAALPGLPEQSAGTYEISRQDLDKFFFTGEKSGNNYVVTPEAEGSRTVIPSSGSPSANSGNPQAGSSDGGGHGSGATAGSPDGHGDGSGSGQSGTGSGGGGDGGPSLPGAKSIRSTKNIMNMSGNELSLHTVVEIRPDGSYDVIEPIASGSPASAAAARQFADLKSQLADLAYHKTYKLKITFSYFPGKAQGEMKFAVVK